MTSDSSSNILAFIDAGGVMMAPIGCAAVIGIAILVERLVALRYSKVLPGDFVVQCKTLVSKGDYAEALSVCEQSDTPAARLVGTAMRYRTRSRSEIKERLEELGRQEAASLEKHTEMLGTVAQASPLMGLLGTVLGMISTFEDIRAQGGSNGLGETEMAANLAGGISEALISTMAGLSVGIPALIAFRWLLTRIDRRVMDLEALCTRVLDHLDEPEPTDTLNAETSR